MDDREWTFNFGDDRLGRLFAPSPILPSQLDGRRRGATSGEVRLVAAILEDAERIYRKYGGCARRPRVLQEAERWVESKDRSWPFSFERVCEILDLDATCIRRALRARRSRAIPGAIVRTPIPLTGALTGEMRATGA
jgi:hypothetical protein